MMENAQYLLIAVLGILGLVFFSSSLTGMGFRELTYRDHAPISNPDAYYQGQASGDQITEICFGTGSEGGECCSRLCGHACRAKECFRGCKYRCQLRIAQRLSPYVN